MKLSDGQQTSPWPGKASCDYVLGVTPLAVAHSGPSVVWFIVCVCVCICLRERGLNTSCLTNCFHNLGADWSLPGREWSPVCRLWLKIALLLYMRFPILLPIPFIYGVAAPWYTCLELVEITFGKKERHSQSLGAIKLTGSLSLSLFGFFSYSPLSISLARPCLCLFFSLPSSYFLSFRNTPALLCKGLRCPSQAAESALY